MSAPDVASARRAAFALGANLGDRAAALQGAVDAIAASAGVHADAVSPVYRTDPVGGPDDQPEYLNAVLVVTTSLAPHALLGLAHDVEQRFGRVRSVRWGPRTLDVDLLAVGAEVVRADDLTVPHPRAHERGFVLAPWADVDAGFAVPGRGRVRDLLAALAPDVLDGVHRVDDPVLSLAAEPR